ncbi:MAG: aromatic ring-hydroxylating dioxygenase subunit alpha [Zoogloea sp.]|nr:aromatic ring-hydroxylating dioxygenase subunit alpha [Zoogloea sp.]
MNAPNDLKWAAKYPDLGTGPIPVEPCVSPEFFEQERQKVFLKSWLKVGRVEEIAKPGDYKVKKLAFAKTSVILMRGKDGQIRGFHNTCSHRGNKVVVETGEETFGRNKAAVVTCRFHGWVYNAHGSIVQVPEENKFSADFDKARNGLTTVHTDVWEGFIFVNLDPSESVTPLAEFLGGIGTHLAGFPYDELSQCFSYHTYLDCNWKVAHDAFAEAYHVSTIHAGSFPNVFSSGLQNVELFGPHRTTAICLSLKNEPTPVAKIANALATGSLVAKRGASMLPPTVNPDRRDDFSFELSVLFPNLLLHVSEGIWFTHQFWPIAHNKTLWEGKYYVRPAKTNSQRWALEHAQCLQRNAWLEDTATMEDTQTALESGAKQWMYLQDDEILIRHGYHALEAYMHAK